MSKLWQGINSVKNNQPCDNFTGTVSCVEVLAFEPSVLCSAAIGSLATARAVDVVIELASAVGASGASANAAAEASYSACSFSSRVSFPLL